MNERIEELKLKAIDFADATYKYDLSEGFKIQQWDAIRLNEFAKLIVNECIMAIRSKECDTSDLAVEEFTRNRKRIKEHFGVEE
jgi:hypothetical protein